MNTTGIQYSTRRHRRLTLPGPEGAIFQPHPPAQLRRRRPRDWLRGGLAAPGVPGGTGPGAAAGCAAATAAAVALSPHPAAPRQRRGLPTPQPGGGCGCQRRDGEEEDGEEAAGAGAPPPRPRRHLPRRGRCALGPALRALRAVWFPTPRPWPPGSSGAPEWECRRPP